MMKTGKVAIVIDGVNISTLKPLFGARYINFKAIQWIVKQVVGDMSIFPVPVITMHPDLCKKGNVLYNDVVKAGISPVSVPSCGGHDDEVVVSRLVHFAKQPDVVALAVFGCDHYEANELLQAARDRRALGNPLRGYLFGTTVLNEQGSPKTSPRVVERFQRSHTVDFVDLSMYQTALFSR